MEKGKEGRREGEGERLVFNENCRAMAFYVGRVPVSTSC